MNCWEVQELYIEAVQGMRLPKARLDTELQFTTQEQIRALQEVGVLPGTFRMETERR